MSLTVAANTKAGGAAAASGPVAAHTSFAVKLLYGLGSIAFGEVSTFLGSALLLFFNQVVGVPASWVGAAIMIALMVDAIFDPLLGQWSDQVRTAWGRRHPFMYASALPLAASFYFLYSPPYGWTNRSLFFYLLALLIAVRLLVSLYEIPSSALAPELTTDYDERTSLLAYRFFFGRIGGAGMAILALRVFLRKDATHPLGLLYRHGYQQVAAVACIVMVVTILASCLGTHGRSVVLIEQPRSRDPFAVRAQRLMMTLSNRSFLSLMIAGIIASIAGGLSSGLGLYITTYFWDLTPGEISYLVAFSFLSAILGVALASVASRKMGKKRAMITLFSIS